MKTHADQEFMAEDIAASASSEVGAKIFLSWNCTMHNGHLVDRGGERLANRFVAQQKRSWKRFNTLAKIANLWREHAKKIWTTWVAQCGISHALKHAKRMMPKCIASRIGSDYEVSW